MGRNKESKRKHHLTHFKKIYEEKQEIGALLFIEAQQLFKKLSDLQDLMETIDANRRENAIALGVSIKESDAAYKFNLSLCPALAEQIKKSFESSGMEMPQLNKTKDVYP